MKRKREYRSIERSAAEQARLRTIRKQFKNRPTLLELVGSGEYGKPISHAVLLDVLVHLKSLRQSAQLSLAEMSERTGMDKSALSRLENCAAPNPTFSTVERYLTALGKRLRIKIEDSR
ncbi:MAG: helix-turn-helix domain-containing protein [Pirellulales bacterium]|nr:helix-turn-helix domain-containing protein [Pirellulales bacterium]